MILVDTTTFQKGGREDLLVGTHPSAGKANPPLPRRATETLPPNDPTATPLFSISSIYIYIYMLIIFYHILVISLLFIYFYFLYLLLFYFRFKTYDFNLN